MTILYYKVNLLLLLVYIYYNLHIYGIGYVLTFYIYGVSIMKSLLIKEKLKNYNLHYRHPSYYYEKKLLNEMRLCLLDEALHTLKEINTLDRPALAYDSIRSLKNSLIGSCTIFTRAVIEAGIDYEDAFNLSDVFIKHIESLDHEKELKEFEYKMVKDFIELIQEDRIKEHPYPISKVVKYIYENASSKLSVNMLAEMNNLSPNYLSKRFHQEVGIPISEYIQIQKIELAKNFLEFSEMKITDIATLLEFCNPAYFTNVFKKHTGISPNTYRKLNMRDIKI